MNIAFDAAAILGPLSKGRGISNYTLNQLTTLIDMDEENHYYFLNFAEEFSLADKLKYPDRLTEHNFYTGLEKEFFIKPEYRNLIGDVIKKFIDKNSIDVFYITSPFDHQFHYQKEWFSHCRVAVTVYDIIPYIFKKQYLPAKQNVLDYLDKVKVLQFSDRILTISESAKMDLIQYMKFDAANIDVIHGAAGLEFQELDVNSKEQQLLLDKFHIKSPFIMCTGGDDERKNLSGLIKAYAQMPKDLINQYELVIVCKLSQMAFDKYTRLAQSLQVEDRVILTGFVTTQELLILYNLAEWLVFPSLYEGFGLPVVEAWACGTPVITSTNSSLGEISKGAAILVDADNIQSITDGMVQALTKADRERYIRLGKERIKTYCWTNVAQKTLDYLKKTVQINSNKQRTESKKKIAMFTPLPPLQSDISYYCVDILNELSQYFDIDVFIDLNYTESAELSNNIRVFPYTKYTNRRNGYIDTVYQMGNSEYHIYMLPFIQKYPGTLVLHDYNLHLLVHCICIGKHGNNLNEYSCYLTEDFPSELVNSYIEDIKNNNTEFRIHEMELNGFVTNYGNKIIVHSDESRKKLFTKDIGRYIRTIRHYAKLEPLKERDVAKMNLGYPTGSLLFASFGHIHKTKRVLPTLKAFHRIHQKHPETRYAFVGKLDSAIEEAFRTYVNANNLEKAVSVTGFTELPTFIEYIDAADICLHLRYPYSGETSGSLMRILAKRKCVIVNDVGSYSEVPEHTCLHIPDVAKMTPEQEIEVISEVMESLIFQPDQRLALEAGARRYAEENLDLKIIGKQYRDFILSDVSHTLTQGSFSQLIKNEIQTRYYTEEELFKLAEFLSYPYS